MKTSFDYETMAHGAEIIGDEMKADYYYALAQEAREIEDDMMMSIPRHERAETFGRWCDAQREAQRHETCSVPSSRWDL